MTTHYMITWADRMLVLMLEGWWPVAVYHMTGEQHPLTMVVRRGCG